MASTRLPGKALMPLPKNSGKVVLDWVIEQCWQTGYAVYVATSTNPEDDAIADRCRTYWHDKVALFRGDPIDVLDRLYQCAKQCELDEIVRITGDCPFVDPDVIRQVVALRRLHNADYASNVDPPTWPDGLDVQVVTFGALDLAWRNATAPTDRDTVLQYIVRNRQEFSVVNLPCPFPNMERERWVLDTANDYEICCDIARHLAGVPVPRLVDLLAAAEHIDDFGHPGARNERYLAARAGELEADDFSGSMAVNAFARQVQPYGASTYSKSHVAFGMRAPLYVTHAQGSRVFDVDGNEFIDFTGALGTTILGHGDPGIRDAIQRQLDLGIAFPLAHDMERNVARKLIHRLHPGKPMADYQVVFGKNGSDVTSAAVRLARVVTGRHITGRHIIIAHEKGYHGWHDWALYNTERDSGVYSQATYRIGCDVSLSDSFLDHTAALIVEPDQLPPDDLRGAMEKCRARGVLVIFDEMVTAMRYPGLTYARTYGLDPDLICLGKALGNGMPITALVGRAEHMRWFVTETPGEPYAFYSGTHFGETLSLAAAAHVLERMDALHLECLSVIANSIRETVWSAVKRAGLDEVIKVGPAPLSRLTFANPADGVVFRQTMARHGCLIYSAFFASLAHSDADLMRLEYALDQALAVLRKDGAPLLAGPLPGIMRS
jgi:glutamate-1-semialdehyde 2,1-aminomutase/spore coat polysaccharide biosynthesis protein SpsF